LNNRDENLVNPVNPVKMKRGAMKILVTGGAGMVGSHAAE